MHALSISSAQPLLPPWSYDRADAQVRSQRRFATGICLSLLAHALLLFVFAPRFRFNESPPSPQARGPLVVHLNRAPPPAPPPVAIAEPLPVPKPSPAPRPVPRPVPRHREAAIAAPKVRQAVPIPVPSPVQEPPPAREEQKAPPQMDFLAMLNAKRRASEEAAAHANAEARANSREPTAEEMTMANINRNLARDREGTSGIFTILSMGTRTATFSFRGWTNDSRNSWRQVIDVDAGLHGDVELAIVRKMIELIRSHYDGDFNWESHRLGRVVVLSARPADNAGLEEFLMREFFSSRG